ncbi:hypothetical protein Tco_0169343 [Tanacetum coccineum]
MNHQDHQGYLTYNKNNNIRYSPSSFKLPDIEPEESNAYSKELKGYSIEYGFPRQSDLEVISQGIAQHGRFETSRILGRKCCWQLKRSRVSTTDEHDFLINTDEGEYLEENVVLMARLEKMDAYEVEFGEIVEIKSNDIDAYDVTEDFVNHVFYAIDNESSTPPLEKSSTLLKELSIIVDVVNFSLQDHGHNGRKKRYVSSMKEYQSQFEQLLTQVDITESQFISMFIVALPTNIEMTEKTPLLPTPRTTPNYYANRNVKYPDKATTLALLVPNT